MKEIKLSQQGKYKGMFVALVDDEDYEYLNQWRWSVMVGKRANYAHGYKDNKIVYMHRAILEDSENMDIDHIDHDGLNNQRHNLRLCSHSDNMKNSKPYGTSIYLGVHMHTVKTKYYNKKEKKIKIAKSSRWLAKIKVANKYISLGRFKQEKDAALAYDNAAKIHHGEFANLNFR